MYVCVLGVVSVYLALRHPITDRYYLADMYHVYMSGMWLSRPMKGVAILSVYGS